MDRSKLGTVAIGGVTMAMGAMMIVLALTSTGAGERGVPVGEQHAVGVVIGVVFAAGGASALLSAFPALKAHPATRLLALIIVAGLTSLFTWIAFGPGQRSFASPLALFGPAVSEIGGRIMFGAGALMGLGIAVAMVRDKRGRASP